MVNFAKGLDSMGDLFPDAAELPGYPCSAWDGVAAAFMGAGGSMRAAIGEFENAQKENGPPPGKKPHG